MTPPAPLPIGPLCDSRVAQRRDVDIARVRYRPDCNIGRVRRPGVGLTADTGGGLPAYAGCVNDVQGATMAVLVRGGAGFFFYDMGYSVICFAVFGSESLP